jgi:hypothetical protein
MLAAPGDYYIAVQKTGEPSPRYVWLEDVAGNSNISLDFNTLPLINSATPVNIASNTSSSFTLYGMKSDDPQGIDGIFHRVQYESNNTATVNYEAMVPSNVFDMYRVNVRYGVSNDGVEYSYISNSAVIPQTIPPVNLGFTVNSNTISNFSMTTQGNFDYFQVSFNYSNPAQNVTVFHNIFGAAASSISFSKATLFDNILADIPNITSGMLSPSESYGLTNYSQFSGYGDFINSPWIYGAGLMDNEFIESVSQ